MTARCRALANVAVTLVGIVTYAVGGCVWLAGVAFLGISYVVLVASL